MRRRWRRKEAGRRLSRWQVWEGGRRRKWEAVGRKWHVNGLGPVYTLPGGMGYSCKLLTNNVNIYSI